MDFQSFILLSSLGTAILILCRRYGLPYVPLLVLISFFISLLGLVPGENLTLEPDILIEILLPPLLFESAMLITFDELKKHARTIAVFALLGTMLTTGLLSMGAHLLLGLSIPFALLLGSALAPTDPPATIAIMKEKRAPESLALLTEAESLFNDGISVVLFTIFAEIAAGHNMTFTMGMADFFHEAVLGALVGILIGGVTGWFTQWFDEEALEFGLTIVASYGAFQFADHLGSSGVLAVVTSGIALRNVATRVTGWSAEVQNTIMTVWEMAAALANSVIFLLVGFQIGHGEVLAALLPALGISVILLAARAVSVYGLSAGLNRSGTQVPLAWQHILIVGGLRGGLGIAMILSLPPSDERAQILSVALWVVLVSLLIQSSFISPLLRKFGLMTSVSGLESFRRLSASIEGIRAELSSWQSAQKEYPLLVDDEFRDNAKIFQLQRKLDEVLLERKKLVDSEPELRDDFIQMLEKDGLEAHRGAIKNFGNVSRGDKHEMIKPLTERILDLVK